MPPRKGWFQIPGVQAGDRAIAEQSRGLEDALAVAAGKSVLDLGCAEGCLAIEFVKAGAREVCAYDYNRPFIGVAEELRAQLEPAQASALSFTCLDLRSLMLKAPPRQFDIVLALGIAHKLPDPGDVLRYAARACADLLLLRGKPDPGADGLIRAKFAPYRTVDGFKILQAEGFRLEQVRKSSRAEAAQYWRRQASA